MLFVNVLMDIDRIPFHEKEFLFGAHSKRETPVPMPNTAVKPPSGYNTWVSNLGKIARCRIIKRPSQKDGLFLYSERHRAIFPQIDTFNGCGSFESFVELRRLM